MSEASEVWGRGTYERVAARLAPVQDQLVELLEIREGERVLDLATGTGEVALRAARAGGVVTGIDIAEPMLAKARERAQQVGAEVAFDLGDVEYLPYEDACFDVLVSNFGVVFAPDHANVASELARVICAGGRLGFTAWKPNPKLTLPTRPNSREASTGCASRLIRRRSNMGFPSKLLGKTVPNAPEMFRNVSRGTDARLSGSSDMLGRS